MLLLLVLSCRNGEERKTDVFQQSGFVFKYQLNKANSRIKLPDVLREISGIANYDNELLACVQDEKKGIVFLIGKKGWQNTG